MAHFKRRRCRRQVKCHICTEHRWKGNSRSKQEGRHKAKVYAAIEAALGEVEER